MKNQSRYLKVAQAFLSSNIWIIHDTDVVFIFAVLILQGTRFAPRFVDPFSSP
jgi:hypothetical protein